MSEEQVKAGRLEWIDCLKGFAILLVVFAHTAERYYKFDLYPIQTPVFKSIYIFIYAFHMPLFMMIPGFLFQLSYMIPSWEEKKHRFWNHLINLCIVYSVFSFVLGGIKFFFSNELLHPVSKKDLFLIWLKPIGHMWYLYILLLLYLVFSLNIVKSAPIWIKIIITAALCLVSTKINYAMFNTHNLLRYSFFFFVGTLLVEEKTFLWRRRLCIVGGGISLAIVIISMISGYAPENVFGIQMLTGLGLSLLFLWSFKNVKALSIIKVLKYLSSYSLEIYILHQYPAVAMTKIVKWLGWNAYIGFIVSFLCSIIIVVFIVELMKKFKIYNPLFNPAKYISFSKNKNNRGDN